MRVAFLGRVAHILGKELYKSTHKRREGRRREEVTEGGIASSHCSIKSVSNDQDEMMAIFLFRDTNLWLSMEKENL